MVVIKGSDLSCTSVAPKCDKYLKPLKRKTIDLNNIGNRHNNALLDFLRCQSKAHKTCADDEKLYTACHRSVMGTGSHKGKRHCGEELESFFTCVVGTNA